MRPDTVRRPSGWSVTGVRLDEPGFCHVVVTEPDGTPHVVYGRGWGCEPGARPVAPGGPAARGYSASDAGRHLRGGPVNDGDADPVAVRATYVHDHVCRYRGQRTVLTAGVERGAVCLPVPLCAHLLMELHRERLEAVQ
jgi:hypothetical protein